MKLLSVLAVLAKRNPLQRLSAFLACWALCLSTPEATLALSADRVNRIQSSGGISADCSDSGILVASAASDKQKKLGNCPLKHTDVNADISGYVARVTVKQQFHNPFKDKIEAVYTFPLPENAAVDEMTMKVGNRLIKGSIKKRDEARQIYDEAKARGNVASLLDQERPNIFTQSVANIEPGQNIDIEIKYVNLLKYEDGSFTFNFPTVVGPRFIPGSLALGQTGSGVAPDTNEVPDASKISPPPAPEGTRAGHDIAITVNINAGVPLQSVQSKLHDVLIKRRGESCAQIKLKDQDKIPNKDFVAVWSVAADSVQSGYLTHREGNEGFFTLMLVPPKKVTPTTVQPKEMIFVIDCSGSQAGLPIKKAKETMDYILEHMNPADTFQIITFNSGVSQFSAEPELAGAAMKARAHEFVDHIQAMGGTWMQPAVEKACSLPNNQHRLRIVTFMTDGYVGNDMEILGLIKKYRAKSRWFSFGTGNSVNRFLIDGIAREGGGEAEYVLLNSAAEEVGRKFYERISSPVLTDIKIDFEGVEPKEVFPKDLSDLWAQKPLYFTGKYTKASEGKVVLSGYSGGKPYKQEMKLNFPAQENSNEVLPSIWARAKVDRLMHEDWQSVQTGNLNEELKNEIINTALKYHIMSQYTSFVAVEDDRSTGADRARRVPVQVETPEGVHLEAGVSKRKSNSGFPRASGPSPVLGASYGKVSVRGPSAAAAGQAGSSGTMSMQSANMAKAAGGKTDFPLTSIVPSSAGSGSGYGMSGLPSTNWGRYVRQPGDNLYYSGYNRPSGASGFSYGPSHYTTSAAPLLASRGGGGGGGGSSCGGSSCGGSGGGGGGGASFSHAPQEMQIIDARPIFKDYREGGSAPANSADPNQARGDVDFGPYMSDLHRRTKKHWFPPRGQESRAVSVYFRIASDGSMSNLRIAKSSGVAVCDQAALKAVQDAAPFRPLPAGAAPHVDIEFKFDYNLFAGQNSATFVELENEAKTTGAPTNKIDPELAKTLSQISSDKSKQRQAKSILVSIDLNCEANSSLREKLQHSGLEIIKHERKSVIGKINPAKIELLAKIAEVVRIKAK